MTKSWNAEGCFAKSSASVTIPEVEHDPHFRVMC